MPPTTARLPLGRAHMVASAIVRDALRSGLPVHLLTPLGSLRRYAPDIGDVSLLAVADAEVHEELLEGFSQLQAFAGVTARSRAHLIAETERGQVALHLAAPEDAGAALVWHTGARGHTTQLQARARERGLRFEEARLLTSAKGVPVPVPTEEAFYRHLALPFIPPELREGADEIAVAERGGLPTLVTELDIRGDLHMHSTWSDGRNSIDEMVLTAQQLGYQYVAITDHSERSLASRKLAAADIPRQRRDIDKVRARATAMHVLHGVEVDIMHDGSLDFGDAELERFDIVLASLHDDGGHDRETLTERYLRAIRHPLVNVITHPANRSPGRSTGYDLDFDVLFRAAVETGTAMEIDGAPGHLDLDGVLARRAVAMGVTLVIDSDCHRADALARQMRFGVGTARRGWVEPAHVLNTCDVDSVREFIARKRSRRSGV